MAESIDLRVILDNAITGAKSDFDVAKKSGATGRVEHSERDFDLLIQRISELAKVTNPTREQLVKINSLFNKLNELMMKLGNNTSSISTATTELIKQEKELSRARQDAVAKLEKADSQLAKKGDGTYGLKSSVKNKAITDLGVTWTTGSHKGQQIRNFDTAAAHPENTSNPEAVKELIATLTRQEQAAIAAKTEAEAAIAELDRKLAEVERSSDSVSSTKGDQIVKNSSERTAAVEGATSVVRQQVSAPNSDPNAGVSADIDKSNNQTSSSLGKAFKQFSLYAIVLRTIKTAAREAVSTIKELDKSLTEQAMVTGKTREQTYALLDSYQKLAAQTGATTKEIAELATQFMRQGKTTEEALTLTEAAMDAAKVAGISATDSVNYLTTALNGFQMSTEDAMKVSDKFAAISANSATSYDEIATALSKVASQANLAGMSIDYTTALLAKGLETTREAPETMGTALKTVIARMREISDYGETLSGDTDVNNVESQLAYVGIALKDANGELRSTEDVLDELGKKWDTLNSNQQAAIAKALAGTRQQSRLIAMMTDYERVIELQEISERSSGATLAQMSTYLEGMDAALNKLSTSWESIITAITDNDAIINLINMASNLLNGFGDFIDNAAGLELILTSVAAVMASMLANKLQQIVANKIIVKHENEALKIKLRQRIEELNALIIAKQKLVTDKKALATKTREAAIQARMNGDSVTAAQLDVEAAQADKEALAAQAEVDELTAERVSNQTQLNSLEMQSISSWGTIASTVSTASGGIMSLITGSQAWLIILTGVGIALKAIPPLMKIVEAEQAKNNALTTGGALLEAAKNAFANLGVPGMILGAVLLTAAGVALGATIAGAINDSKTSTADYINDLSNEIYKLNEKVTAIESVTSSYEELDNQIIKTKADQEEMNELLSEAADELDEDEQDIYNTLTTNQQKVSYLATVQEQAQTEANEKRREQLNEIAGLSDVERASLLSSNTADSDVLTAQSAIYAINNNNLYDYIDSLEEANKYTSEYLDSVEDLTQSMIEGLSPAQAYWYAQNPEQLQKIVDKIAQIKIEYKNTNGELEKAGIAEILTSDDYDILDKVNAYKAAIAQLDDESAELLTTLYSDIDTFSKFSNELLEWIDNSGVSIDNINNIAKAIQKLGYNASTSATLLKELFTQIQEGSSISSAIEDVFANTLNQYEKGSDEWLKIYDKILNAYGDAIGTGILNMGQNLESLKNTIDDFYEKASEWSTMSDSDKTSFLTNNAELFEGQAGEKLLQAIESGDYKTIYDALADQDGTLAKKVQQQIDAIQTELDIENARVEEERDYAYIKYLEEQKEVLEDSVNLYAASLDTRLEQEQAYLDEYKSYLEDQKDALQDSLDDRKEAYQNYFDAVNQEMEDEDFEEQESTLIANISKLATSGSADAINQTTNLEQQLEDLEEERIQTLRERAQDEILENIDDQIEEINDKFDDLLNSNQALLAAMTDELDNPTEFLSNLISNKVDQEGLTQLGLESYIQDLRGTYSSLLGSDVFDNMSVEKQGDQLILNIAGTEIQLSDNDQQSVYTAIMAALQQVGLR